IQAGATRITQEPNSVTARSVDYYHFYGQINWWLTRERNRYNPTTGTFDRIMPLKPLNQGGLGAIGFAMRFHRLLLSDGGSNPSSGNIWGLTAGLTWKPNPYVKFMGEYVYANRSPAACVNTGGTECAATGDAPRGVQFRALFDF
ncbi:MAG: hypothetical protein GDA54_04250, partial [Alphaproteobacteria bacterium GM7ARS4]|nr:hypothetical protein [Alphaproteobacteria bacterium GM7ARS4]